MRGRTNAQGGGIFLNASTDKYVVANTDIAAGDFVNRYTLIEGGTFLSSERGINSIFALPNSRYLLIRDNAYYTIVKKNSDGTFTEQVSLQDAANIFINGVMQVDENTFISVKKIYSSSNTKSGSITFTLVKIDDLNGVTYRDISVSNVEMYSASNYNTLIKPYNLNNYCVINVSYTYSSPEYLSYISLARFAITGTSYDNYAIETKYNPTHMSFTASSVPKIKFAEKLGDQDNYITVFEGSTELNKYSHLIINNAIYDVNHQIPNIGFGCGMIKYNSNHVAFVSSDGKYPKNYVSYVNGTIDLSANQVIYSSTTTIIDEIAETTTPNYSYVDTYNNVDLYLSVSLGGRMLLLYADTVNNTVSMYPQSYIKRTDMVVSIIKDGTKYVRGGGFVKDDAQKNGSIGTVDIDNTNHCMVGTITTTKYVDHIDSTDFVIGVAKQSGSKGDEIDVYVPVVD